MMRSSTAAALEGRFDNFLYAAVREESDGMPLTVLSFLARLNFDPWEEAAKLAQLPREVAAGTLEKLIAALPDGGAVRTDAGTIAARLVSLLPRKIAGASVASTAGSGLAGVALPKAPAARYLMLYVVWIVLLLLGQWLGVSTPTPHVERPPMAATVPAATPPSVSSPSHLPDAAR